MKTRPALSSDFSAISSLLNEAELLIDDLDRELKNFIVGTIDDQLCAAGGLEVFGRIALLRSVVVAEQCRGQKAGSEIVEKLRAHAKTIGIQQLYLLTRSAENFFAALGFEVVTRDLAPKCISETSQFSELCPTNAALMRLSIEQE